MFTNIPYGQKYNTNFLALLNSEVDYAHSLNMAVVINDQTEFTNNSPSPTNQTAKFWQIIANQYKSKSYVIFDIFNEPRVVTAQPDYTPNKLRQAHILLTYPQATEHRASNRLSVSQVWGIWKNGGVVNGVNYLGMQDIVNTIRLEDAHNIIWIEGAYGARKLPPNNSYLLNGSNLVYDIHHPDLNVKTSWNRIGSLSQIRPVVDGEWAQYQSDWAECYSDAYTNAPAYLSFLESHNIGVIAWSLQADSLVTGDGRVQPNNLNTLSDPLKASDLRYPSNIRPNYSCDPGGHGQGVGELLQEYFNKNSKPILDSQ